VTARGPDLALLAKGELRLAGLLPRASNYTFLGEVVADGRTAPVVYKPRGGETPLWDFPDGTLYRREVAAFVLSEALGWPNVPPTVSRDGPHGVGSVQLFVRADPGSHYLTLRDRHPDVFRAVAAFDVVAGNGDRKAGHCLLGEDGHIWVVDHGLCFNADPILRTVIWDFAGEPVPEPLLEDLRRVERDLRNGPLRASMRDLLDLEEVEATAARAGELIEAGTLPEPGPGRSVPWPPL
jgi:uncharacterized repeat protein (TIGR03843 family)